MKTRQRGYVMGAAAVVAAAIAYVVVDDIINRDRHIAWHELRESNHEQFLKQLAAALPAGTPKEKVDAYLASENIPYSYDVAASRSTYTLRAYGAGRALWILIGDLGADIVLDDKQEVRVITRFAIYPK